MDPTAVVRAVPDTQQAKAQRSGQKAVFRLTNDGGGSDDFTFTCSRTGNVSACTAPASIPLEDGDTALVEVPFTTGAAGSGTVSLTATAVFSFGNFAQDAADIVVADTFAVSLARLDSNPVRLDISSSKLVRFNLTNRTTRTVSFSTQCVASGSVTCSWGTVTKTLARDSTATIQFSVNGMSEGPGTVMFTATSDSLSGGLTASSSYDIEVAHPGVFALAGPKADRLSRGGCPILGAGPESAVQCGDLLYAHALPGYRSLNKARGVTLLYNSATARPTPWVAVDYTTVNGDTRPDSVLVEVRRNGSLIASTYFSPAGFNLITKEVHRLVVPIDAQGLGLATGAYPVQVKLRRFVNGAWLGNADTASTTLLVVNRRATPFGAGWSLAGIERLHPNQDGGHALLVQGDGSALLFRANADTTFRSPAGERSKLVRRTAGGFVRTLKGGRVTITYDAAGLVQTIADNNDSTNVATYKWTAQSLDGARLDTIVDPVGKKVAITYDANGRASALHVPGVQVVRLFQNVSGSAANLDSIADPDSLVLRYTYASGTHLMASSKSRGTGIVQYFYHPTVATLDSASAPGNTGHGRWFRAWQRFGAPLATTGTAASPATPALASEAVIASHQTRSPSKTVTALFRVDRFFLPLEATLPGGMSTWIDRDTLGQPVFVRTTSNGKVWQQWDSLGNLTATIVRVFGGWTNPNAVHYDTTRYRYDDTWQEIDTIVDARGKLTTFTYDTKGRRLTAKDALGRVTSFEYTARGLLKKVTEPGPTGTPEVSPTSYAYDGSTQNLLSISKGAATTSYQYNSATDLVAAIDAEQQETVYTYDAMKRPLSMERGRHNATGARSKLRYQYDDAARTYSQLGPLGADVAVTRFDLAGRVVEHCVRAGWCDETTYGDGVNPTWVKSRGGKVTVQEFDDAGRVTRKELYAGTSGSYEDLVALGYDAAGNPTSIINKYSRVYRQYDEYGRLISEQQGIRRWADTWADSAEAKAFVRVQAWHDYDRLGRRATTWLDSGTVSDVHACWNTPLGPDDDPDDDPCRREGRKLASRDSITYAYDDVGNLTAVRNTLWLLQKPAVGQQMPSHAWQYTYDQRNRLKTLTAPTTSQTLVTTWDYNTLDQLTTYTTAGMPYTIGITPDLIGRAYQVTGGFHAGTYTYDGLGQLVSKVNSGSLDENFTYDSLGNRLTSGVQWSYTYNNRGQLVSKAGGGCTATYTYDLSGNRLTAAGCNDEPDMTLEYDASNRMVKQGVVPASVTVNDPIASRRFRYDGLGRRIVMKSDSVEADDYGVWRYWWLDDNVAVKTHNLFTDPELVEAAIYDPDIRRGVADSLRGSGEWFYYGPGVDNVLASWNAGGDPTIRHHFFKDHRGSVIAVTNAAGSNLGKSASAYTVFGAGVSAPATAATNPGYNGHESAGGLVYMRNRWYDPNTGQFTQQDPIGFAGGVNLYGYVGNDPLTYSDPYGLEVSYAQELKGIILDLWKNSETFRGIYNSLHGPDPEKIHYIIRIQTNSEAAAGKYAPTPGTFLSGRNEITTRVGDPAKGIGPSARNLAHEIAHAGGQAALRGIDTGVPKACAGNDDPNSMSTRCVRALEERIMNEYDKAKEKKPL